MEERKRKHIELLEKLRLDWLKRLSEEFPDKDPKDLMEYAKQYFAAKATEEMDKLFEEKGWGDEKIEEWSKARFRTPYKLKSTG